MQFPQVKESYLGFYRNFRNFICIEERQRPPALGGRVVYEIWATDDFNAYRYHEQQDSLQAARSLINARFEKVQKLETLDNVELYSHSSGSGERVWVSFKQRDPYRTPILAKDVQVGSYLTYDAAQFFRFWKGEAAVPNPKQDRTLQAVAST